jgi:putative CocE/NonD family hydrolase
VLRAVLLVSVFLAAMPCIAQQLSLASGATEDPERLSAEMASLAQQTLERYRDPDRARYLDTLSRLQLVATQYDAAVRTLSELRALHKDRAFPHARASDIQYTIIARARALQARSKVSFDQAFQQIFSETFRGLDDRTSALAIRALVADQIPVGISMHLPIEEDLRKALAGYQSKRQPSLPDALTLLRAYQIAETYRSIRTLVPALIAADDQRRYLIDNDVLIATPDGAHICALIVRPRTAPVRLPALMEFTIYADPTTVFGEARRSASNGYAGVAGYVRGKACSPDRPIPFEHDGADAAALIDWISKQPWSDGRVGMFGASYNGFTQWAAAKRKPKALKALMPLVTVAPAIDAPMEGNVFASYMYPWPFYTTTNKTLDPLTYGDRTRWSRLNQAWYRSGRSYRDLDKIDGVRNPVFDRWLEHPTYDAYWSSMIPQGEEFAQIDIPILAATGYGEVGVLHYFRQHYRYRPNAEHYVVIGPYDHATGNRGTVNVLGDTLEMLDGYRLDPAALIDLGQLRYEWFDYVFRGVPKPALLEDRLNYQVMGANVWKHVRSLDAISVHSLRFYLSGERNSQGPYRLSERPPPAQSHVDSTVNLADRADAERPAEGGHVLDSAIDSSNGVAFVSEPFREPPEISGLFAGHLALITNKKDFDFTVQLYELTGEGKYLQLSSYQSRASHVADATQRHLLVPQVRQTLDFRSARLMSRQFQAGSRLVAVLRVIKQPDMPINYGTGKDVSDETIADAAAPLQIQWLGESFLTIPLGREFRSKTATIEVKHRP